MHFGFLLNFYFRLPVSGIPEGLWIFSIGLLFLVFVQLLYGALMAGNKAAAVAPTWPRINGDWFPDSLFRQIPFLLNFIGNKITIHFIHRNLAYLIFLGISIWTLRLFRSGIIRSQRIRLLMPLILVLVTDPAGHPGLTYKSRHRGQSLGCFRLVSIIAPVERYVAAFQPDLCDLCVKTCNEVILIRSFR